MYVCIICVIIDLICFQVACVCVCVCMNIKILRQFSRKYQDKNNLKTCFRNAVSVITPIYIGNNVENTCKKTFVKLEEKKCKNKAIRVNFNNSITWNLFIEL